MEVTKEMGEMHLARNPSPALSRAKGGMGLECDDEVKKDLERGDKKK